MQLWRTYLAWYDMLVEWAGMIVPEHAARRCVRRALAEVYILALNAYETLDGPYMHSVDVLYRYVCMEPSLRDQIMVQAAFQSIQYPDAELLSDMARLYASAYETGYTSRLTLHGRTEIAALIRLYDPEELSYQQLNERLSTVLPSAHPLRCVVDLIGACAGSDDLVAQVASQLWEDEEQRGAAWLKRMTIENGVKT